MDFSPIWDQFASSVRAMPQSGLLMAALGAMLLGLVGSVLLRPAPAAGRLLRGASTLGLMGVLVLVVLQLARSQ